MGCGLPILPILFLEYQSAEMHPTRSFNSPKNYLFPLPDDEVKRAPNLKQKSGLGTELKKV